MYGSCIYSTKIMEVDTSFESKNKIIYCGHCNAQLGYLNEISEENSLICSHHECLKNTAHVSLEDSKIYRYECDNATPGDKNVLNDNRDANISTDEEVYQTTDFQYEQPSTSTTSSTSQWTDNMTKCLITSYKTHREKFESPMYNKKQVWERISKELMTHEIEKSGKKCDEKWRNMKKMYDKILTDQKSTGAGKVFWKYFDDFKELYFNDPRFNPVLTASSTGVLKKRNINIEVTELDTESDKNEETTPKKNKLSPGEEGRKKILSSYEVEQRRQKRHDEKMAMKKEMFNWFKNNFEKNQFREKDNKDDSD